MPVIGTCGPGGVQRAGLPHRRFSWRGITCVLACLTGVANVARAQQRTPLFVLQPGMLSADFISASPPGAISTTGFSLRFATLIPTSSRWWTLIVGANVTPYGTSGVGRRTVNTPTVFAGNVIPVLAATRTRGWAQVDLPILLTYTYGGGGPHNSKLYGRDIVAESAVMLNLGRKVLGDLGPFFQRLRVHLLLDQNLTPNEDPGTGKIDRFNPVAIYGITIPFGRESDRRD